MRLAEDDHARRDRALGERGGDRRDAVRPVLRAAGGDATLEIHEVLERDRHAVQRADAVPGADGPVGAFGGEPRLLVVEGDERVQGRVALDALEQRIDDVDGREGSLAVRAGQLGRGGPDGIDRGHAVAPR